jgi:glutamate-1-semialdehyde 2,1-aminomutase
MDVYTEEEVERLNALGEQLKASVEGVLKKHGVVKQEFVKSAPCPEENELESPFTGSQVNGAVQSSITEQEPRMFISGKGSMLSIHFSGESEKSLLALFWHHMLGNGIYLATRGFITLNLELRLEHVQKFVAATEAFVVEFKEALL